MESPTQIAPVTQAAGLGSVTGATMRLVLFVIGLLASTICVTFLFTWGFMKASMKKGFYIVLGSVTGVYSVGLGLYMMAELLKGGFDMKGKALIIGFGPGSYDHITERAKQAIQESDCIVGYKTYVELISGLITDQKIISTGMSEEVSRAQAAVKMAEDGQKVAVISSGDAGVYGMSGLVYEVLVEKGWKEATGVEVEVIPGISAINSCASLLGAPVMHDACTISLSDHLTPWKLIEKRIEAAAQADFVIAFYNPKSGRRTRQIVEAQKILLRHRSPETPVGLVKVRTVTGRAW